MRRSVVSYGAWVLAALLVATCSGCSLGPGEAPPLIDAASVGDDAEVRRLVESGVDVNTADGSGYTALMDAAGIHESTLTLLIALGADVNALDDNRVSALYLAAYRGSASAMKILMEAGADAEVTPTGGSLAGLTLCEAAEKSKSKSATSLAC